MALAGLLKGYGICSRSVRLDDGSTPKGYCLRSFQQAFEHYLPPTSSPPTDSGRHAATTPGKPQESEDSASATRQVCGGSENAGNPSSSAACGGVAAQRPIEVGSEPNAEDDEGLIWKVLMRNK